MAWQINEQAVELLELRVRSGHWTLDAEQRAVRWSAGACVVHGVDQASSAPTLAQVLALYDDESARQLLRAIERALEDGSGGDLLLRLRHGERTSGRLRCFFEACRGCDGRIEQLIGGYQYVSEQTAAAVREQTLAGEVRGLEARWQPAIDGNELGLWDWDESRGELFVSDRLKSMLGYPAEELNDPSAGLALIHPDDREECMARLRAHRRGQTPLFTSEHRLRCRDGSYRWILSRCQAVHRDAAGRATRLIGTHTDIQDRRAIEESLREGEKRFRTVFNSSYQYIGLLSTDGLVLEVNDTALAAAELPLGAVVGVPLWASRLWALRPETAALVRELIRRAAAGESVRQELEITIARRQALIDLSIQPLRDDWHRVTQLILEARDITEARATQAALHMSERRFWKIMQNAPIGLAIVSLTGYFLEVNDALCDITGYSREELLSRSPEDITHPDDRSTDHGWLNALSDGQVERIRQHKRYLHRHGHAIWVQIDVSIVRSDDGRPQYIISQIQDISEHKHHEARLFEARELDRVTLRSIGEGVIRVDAAGVIRMCNPSAAMMIGAADGELVGRPFHEVIQLHAPGEDASLPDLVGDAIAGDRIIRDGLSTRLRRLDGSWLPIAHSISPIHDRESAVIGAVFVFQDVSDTVMFTERLAFQAQHDALTGLPNRLGFELQLRRRLQERQSAEFGHYLVFMDLDHFKHVNDSCGHAAGDQLLIEIAQLLKDSLRPDDFVARLGGDEFAMILPHTTADGARCTAERVVRQIGDYRMSHQGRSFAIGASAGLLALCDLDGRLDDALAHADMACYAAKNSGRGRVQIYHPEDADIRAAHSTISWSQRIRDALQNERMVLYLQRIVDGQGRVRGYESLVRMRGPDGRLVPPGEFLPSAQRLGLMPAIDRWVIGSALGLIERYRSGLRNADLYISVNLDAQTVGDRDFANWLGDMLQKRGDGPGRLRFEITETDRLRSSAAERDLFEHLRCLGYQIHLDDFGCGYNSFELLKRLPVDGIKLDGSVVRDYGSDPVDEALVHAAVGLAQSMRIQLVAEGVETQALLDRLTKLGITRYQGHLFHVAEPFEGALRADGHTVARMDQVPPLAS